MIFCIGVSALWGKSDPMSGIMRVHQLTISGAEFHYLRDSEVAFLVDKKAGLFVTFTLLPVDPPKEYIPDLRLISKDGKVLRCCAQFVVGSFVVLQVHEEDRMYLKDCHEFQVQDTPPALYDPVSILSAFDKNRWEESNIASVWESYFFYPIHYSVPIASRKFVVGSPILSRKSGKVVGVMHQLQSVSTAILWPCTYVAQQLQHLKKYGVPFTAYLGMSFKLRPIQELEAMAQCPFNPPGFRRERVRDNRVLTVHSVWRDSGRLVTPEMQAGDVVLAIDIEPIYSEEDVWSLLAKAHRKGQKDVHVTLWRFGQVVQRIVPLQVFNAVPIKRVVQYKDCRFFDYHKGAENSVMMRCGRVRKTPLFRLEYIQEEPISTTDDVIRVLKAHPHGNMWLRAKVYSAFSKGYSYATRFIYHLPQTAVEQVVEYCTTGGWHAA